MIADPRAEKFWDGVFVVLTRHAVERYAHRIDPFASRAMIAATVRSGYPIRGAGHRADRGGFAAVGGGFEVLTESRGVVFAVRRTGADEVVVTSCWRVGEAWAPPTPAREHAADALRAYALSFATMPLGEAAVAGFDLALAVLQFLGPPPPGSPHADRPGPGPEPEPGPGPPPG